MPRWGMDMDENTIPNEAGLEKRAINYDKGCYIGQETIARIKTYGHVNRQLVQMAFTGQDVPARGDKIVADVREVGQVTSAVFSSRLGKPLALGYVGASSRRRASRSNGTINQWRYVEYAANDVVGRCGGSRTSFERNQCYGSGYRSGRGGGNEVWKDRD